MNTIIILRQSPTYRKLPYKHLDVILINGQWISVVSLGGKGDGEHDNRQTEQVFQGGFVSVFTFSGVTVTSIWAECISIAENKRVNTVLFTLSD